MTTPLAWFRTWSWKGLEGSIQWRVDAYIYVFALFSGGF